jgi:hypothetical protein
MSRRHVRRSFLALPLAALLAVAAGCGGSGSASPPVANVGSSKTGKTSTQNGSTGSGGAAQGGSANSGSGPHLSLVIGAGTTADARRFAACMRKHGVPNFPDPNGQGVISIDPSSGIDPKSPTYGAAEQTCSKLLPNGGQPSPAQQAAAKRHALAFSVCMRRHGVHDFPDPDFSGGGISIRLHGSLGSDLTRNSPIFKAAWQACQGDLPGKLGGGK